MNYEAEVKKVYPGAFCKRVHNIDSNFIYAIFSSKPMAGNNLVSDDFENHRTSKEAWESAYNNSLNKIKS